MRNAESVPETDSRSAGRESGAPHSEPRAPHPDDAELIAYLDGELDEATARVVEARLTADPATRKRADAFRRSFALLDALPKPDPPADFTARTVTRLMPAGASTTAVRLPTRARLGRRRLLAAVSVLLAGLLGASARLAVRPSTGSMPPLIADLPVIESLPLYVGADDLDFVRRLDTPGLFADGIAAGGSSPTDPSPEARQKLSELFQGFSTTRQRQLRGLHADLTGLPAVDRSRLTGVLEQYAGWLDRLPDAERSRVLSADTSGARLTAVQDAVLTTRREALPARKREQLSALRAGERLQLLGEAQAADRTARADWARAADHWRRQTAAGAKPWPFDQPDGLAKVDEFVRVALQSDPTGTFDPGGCRLSLAEFADLRVRREAAVKDGQWFLYGLAVWRLADRHPSLPRFKDKPPVLSVRDLTDPRLKRFAAQIEKRATAGRWPEFAQDVAAVLASKKPFALIPTSALGPCKPGEFTDPVEAVIVELLPLLSDAERRRLKQAEGRWPEYPDLLMKLAKERDREVPGVSLPGSPSEWAATYGRP